MVSLVLSRTSDVLASALTTNQIWLAAPVPPSATRARYTPDTAVAGTAHEAETAQLPQSTRPVGGSVRQGGCCWGSGADGCTTAIWRAPLPW